MNVSTLQMVILMACGVAVIAGITIATTSKSRLAKVAGYLFNAILIGALAAAVFWTPADDVDDARIRTITGFLLLGAAVWAVVSATRAYLRK